MNFSPLSGVWNIKAIYGDWYAWIYDRYVAKAVSDIGQQEVEEVVLSSLPNGSKLLDVGCGGAHRITSIVRSRPDLHIIGVDSSPRQLAFAKHRVRRQGLKNVDLELGNVEGLRFENSSFHAVLIMGSLKHWKNVATGFKECLRVLKPGGLMLAMDSNRDTPLTECRSLVGRMTFPLIMRPVAFWHLRKYVIGQSMSLEEARNHWNDLNLTDKVGPRLIPDSAAWIMWGRKP